MAPYRVGTAHALSLLHDWSTLGLEGKREDMLAMMGDTERHSNMIKRLYVARTRMSDAQLEAMMRRDLWLDAPACLRLGIYDRVVRPDRAADIARYLSRSAMASLRLSRAVFMKTNWNVLFSSCAIDLVHRFDTVLASPAKPVVFMTPGSGDCEDPTVMMALAARIQASPVPVFGVIDSVVTWWQLLPLLYCHRRYMYENTSLDAAMIYQSIWGKRVEDIVENAERFRAIIRDAVRARAKPTAALLGDMFERRVFLTPQQCLANGLIDEIVPLRAAVNPL